MNAKLETTKNVGSYFSNCDSESGESATQLTNEISRTKSTLMLKYISPLSGKVPLGFKKSRPVRKEPSKIR